MVNPVIVLPLLGMFKYWKLLVEFESIVIVNPVNKEPFW